MQGVHDLNLAFPTAMDNYHGMSPYVEMPKLEIGGDHSTSHSHHHSPSAVELLRSGMASRGLNPYASSKKP